MIPSCIETALIRKAMQRIRYEGVPPQRRSRSYCLVDEEDGGHYPPKYTITLAYKSATGRCLHSDEFSGGPESNRFLESCGFKVVKCGCGGHPAEPNRVTARPTREIRESIERHSERCPECKTRVRELLERIYGTCLRNHRFPWPAHLCHYEGTSSFPALRNVATVLEECRNFCLDDFMRAETVAPCDFWVPDPGFVVEFDESQHFTNPRKLALSAYPSDQSVGFSKKRWIALCEKHKARDNDPPYRDEQRAWYDTLRDIVPSLEGLRPTWRLYARDFAWCSLNPESSNDQRCFLDIARQSDVPTNRPTAKIDAHVARAPSVLRAALVFPEVSKGTSHGIPPSGAGAQEPDVPTLTSFAGETVDFALFPEGYIDSSDKGRIKSLSKLASDLGAPLLVGAVDKCADSTGRTWQILIRFDPPDGICSRVYTKHSTAEAVAFERSDWEPEIMLPTFELGGVKSGATICHDHYLGLLPRFLAKHGARVWVNPSFDNVMDIKWSSVLRLRAVENGFFALCTLHDKGGKSTHPFAFSPEGKELSGRKVGCKAERPLSECKESGTIYVVDLDMGTVGKPFDWSKLPCPRKPKGDRKGQPQKLIRVALINEKPAVLGRLGWQPLKEPGSVVETDHGSIYVGVVPKGRILDAAECFYVLDRAKHRKFAPIIWNAWDEFPTDPARLATLMMGRTIECCAPILVSDRTGIHELVELSNRNKIPARRCVEASGEATVDIEFAWGLDNAFKPVTGSLTAGNTDMKTCALDRYRRLAEATQG